MIKVTFFRTKESKLYSFEITGHAESGPYGHDLVCSAVSALSIGTVNSLSQLADITPQVSQNELEGGYLKVSIPKDLDENEKSQLLLDHLNLSMKSIEEEYNQYIQIYESDN